MVLLKQITEAIHKRFYFQVPLVYNYSTYCTEESSIYFLCFTVLFLTYFFYIFGFIKVIIEAIYRWFYFLSTAGV